MRTVPANTNLAGQELPLDEAVGWGAVTTR